MSKSPIRDLVWKIRSDNINGYTWGECFDRRESEITALENRLNAQITHSYDERQIRDAMRYIVRIWYGNEIEDEEIDPDVDQYLAEHPAHANNMQISCNSHVNTPTREQIEVFAHLIWLQSIKKVYTPVMEKGLSGYLRTPEISMMIDEICGKEKEENES